MLLTELPVYLYHHEEVPQRGDGALFHFTKLDSFLKILEVVKNILSDERYAAYERWLNEKQGYSV